MILSTEVTLPLRVKSMEQQFQEGRGPVNIYTLQLDLKQARSITKDWTESLADDDGETPNKITSPWVIIQELKIACEEFLPIGVGDLFSIDLVPRDAVEEVLSPIQELFASFFNASKKRHPSWVEDEDEDD